MKQLTQFTKNTEFHLKELSHKSALCCNGAASSAGLFAERGGAYLNEFNLYLYYFNRIPNFIHEIKAGKKSRTGKNDAYSYQRHC